MYLNVALTIFIDNKKNILVLLTGSNKNKLPSDCKTSLLKEFFFLFCVVPLISINPFLIRMACKGVLGLYPAIKTASIAV